MTSYNLPCLLSGQSAKHATRFALMALILACLLGGGRALAEDTAPAIAAGDTLYVQVHRHPELSSTAQVDDSGHVELTYVGRVLVAGLSEAEAGNRITQAYTAILKNPRVMISRKAMASVAAGYRPRTEEMDTRVVSLNNSSAEALNAALSGMSTAGGSVNFDPNTNTLILTDTPTTLQKMMTVVQELDQMQSQIMQVHIESKIAEVESTAAREVGVRWFAQGDTLGTGYWSGTRQDSRVSGIRRNSDPMANERVQLGDRFGSTQDYINEGNWDRRVQIPLQVAMPGQYFLGFMNSGIDLGLMLDALIADNKAEMLAAPYIRTINHQKAEIKMTEEYPFSETGAAGFTQVTTTKFLDVGIVLEVTPHVRRTTDGQRYVQLELQPEVSSATGVVNGVPVRSVRSSKSCADVLDGQTLVIGGIVNNDSRDVIQKVPGLGNVPVVGALFRHKERSKQARELMIFVTPHVFEHPGDITSPPPLDLSSTAAATNLEEPTHEAIESRKE